MLVLSCKGKAPLPPGSIDSKPHNFYGLDQGSVSTSFYYNKGITFSSECAGGWVAGRFVSLTTCCAEELVTNYKI